jgi:hypothetical protein
MRSIFAVCAIGLALASAPAAYAGDDASAPPADQTCQHQQNNNTAVGAAIGAVVGGVVGNNVAASGHHGAGTVLGAAVGGVTGGVIGHNTTHCDAGVDTPEVVDTGKPNSETEAAPPADSSPPK